MNTEAYEQWSKLSKNFESLINPLSNLGKTTTEISIRTAQQNLDILSEHFARMSKQLDRLRSIRKPDELIELQKDCLNQNLTALIENSQQIMQTAMQNMEELTKLFETTYHSHLNTTMKNTKRTSEESERQAR